MDDPSKYPFTGEERTPGAYPVQRVPGARKTKGRTTSGHLEAIEIRTWQETRRAEELDRIVRQNGRLDPPAKPQAQDAPRGLRKGFRRV